MQPPRISIIVVDGDAYDQSVADEMMNAFRVYAQWRQMVGRPKFELRAYFTRDGIEVFSGMTYRTERKCVRPVERGL